MISRWFGWLKPKRLDIYHFWDGARWRAVDPLVAWRTMWEHPLCDPDRDFGPATGYGPSGETISYDPQAQDRVLAMARDMFGVSPWTESQPGLTINETFSLLWDFLGYMESLKKKRSPLPTTSAHSGSTSSPPTDSSITPPESDLSSIELESRSDASSSSSKRSVQL
jgi:hypothetical protein